VGVRAAAAAAVDADAPMGRGVDVGGGGPPYADSGRVGAAACQVQACRYLLVPGTARRDSNPETTAVATGMTRGVEPCWEFN